MPLNILEFTILPYIKYWVQSLNEFPYSWQTSVLVLNFQPMKSLLCVLNFPESKLNPTHSRIHQSFSKSICINSSSTNSKPIQPSKHIQNFSTHLSKPTRKLQLSTHPELLINFKLISRISTPTKQSPNNLDSYTHFHQSIPILHLQHTLQFYHLKAIEIQPKQAKIPTEMLLKTELTIMKQNQ